MSHTFPKLHRYCRDENKNQYSCQFTPGFQVIVPKVCMWALTVIFWLRSSLNGVSLFQKRNLPDQCVRYDQQVVLCVPWLGTLLAKRFKHQYRSGIKKSYNQVKPVMQNLVLIVTH
jgi:hypothetical protein